MTTLNRLLIRDRLNLLVLLPLSVVLLMTVPFVADRVQDARQADTTANLVGTARQLSALVQELERERLVSVAYLASRASRRNPLVTQAQTVANETARVRRSLRDTPAPKLEAALDELNALAPLRQRILTHTTSPDAVNQAFAEAVASLIDTLGLAQGVATGTAGARQQTALDALLRANEENSSAGAGMLAMVVQQTSGTDVLAAVGTSVRLEKLEVRRFQQLASPAQVNLFDTADTGQAALRVEKLRKFLEGKLRQDPQLSSLTADQRVILAGQILGAVETETGLRRLVQDKIARDVASDAQGAAERARLAGLSFATVAIVLLIVVVLLSVAIGRSIARPLRRLTNAAGQVADLAQAELIRVTDDELDEDAPVRLAAVDVPADDEIGDLAAALNRVQATAALLLERQVASRRNIAAMFGSVGRRTQNLVGRQLSMIDALERNEQNMELLERLYRLDHLSARLRRHADSLVVLSGVEEQVLVSSPMRIGDVIRSALAEIEDFQRVQIGALDDVRVAPDVTRDLRLLVAELLENAASFSPPFTDVEVAVHRVEVGCELEIVDHGVGMTAERMAEENARLVRRERLDVTPSDVLGLFVVGRLCRRHGFQVTLAQTSGGGVTAYVYVPVRYLVETAEGDTSPAAGRVAVTRTAVIGQGAERRGADERRPAPSEARAAGRVREQPAVSGNRGSSQDGWFQASQSQTSQSQTSTESFASPPAPQAPRASLTDTGSFASSPAPQAPRASLTDQPLSGQPGLVQRVRGAQLPDTGEKTERHSEPGQYAPETARDLVEQFEAGELLALRAHPDRGAEPDPAPDPAPDQAARVSNPAAGADQRTAAVQSFAQEIDRELRRTLESLTTQGRKSGDSSTESDFHWLDAPDRRDQQVRGPAATEPGEVRPGLVRRVPGAQMPAPVPEPLPEEYPSVAFDADAARATIEEFEAGVARAMEVAQQDELASQEDGAKGADSPTWRGDDA